MRIMTEIKLDRTGPQEGQRDIDPARVADHINEEFVTISPGQSVYVDTPQGEAEFTVTATRTWAEADVPTGERETTAGTSEMTPSFQR